LSVVRFQRLARASSQFAAKVAAKFTGQFASQITGRIAALILLGSSFMVGTSVANADRVRDACTSDYLRFCSQYKPESSQTRACMRANGRSLSSGCINALVDAGIVDRRVVRAR
jgi:hypothetical protein